jgi:hypothetical protein
MDVGPSRPSVGGVRREGGHAAGRSRECECSEILIQSRVSGIDSSERYPPHPQPPLPRWGEGSHGDMAWFALSVPSASTRSELRFLMRSGRRWIAELPSRDSAITSRCSLLRSSAKVSDTTTWKRVAVTIPATTDTGQRDPSSLMTSNRLASNCLMIAHRRRSIDFLLPSRRHSRLRFATRRRTPILLRRFDC